MGSHDTTSPPDETGRGEAFVALVASVERELRGYVENLVRPRHLAESLVQQAFLKAWGHAEFDPRRPEARAFLFTVAANLVRDWQSSADSRVQSLEELSASGSRRSGSRSADPLADRAPADPLADLIRAEQAARLRAALAELTAEHRDALERFYLRGEGSQFAIARALGLTVPAFNSRLNRARIELKRRLEAPGRPGRPRELPS